MKRFLLILAGALAMTAGAGSAWADGSIKDAPAVAEVRSCGSGAFQGWYIGGAIGGGRHDAEMEDKLGPGGVDSDDGVFTVSGYSGYNIQCGRFVIGYESDINWLGADSTFRDCCQSLTSEIDWYGTARLRLGLVHDDRMMFYVTGGLAYAEVDHSFSVPLLSFSEKDSDRAYGWTIGGGVEFIRHDRWSLRAEGMYIDLGEETESYEDAVCGVACTARIGWNDEFWVGRVGLTYRFGAREEAVPLK